MNIMQYRELKAQEEQAKSNPSPVTTPVTETPATPPVQEKPAEVPATPAVPEKFNIDGIGEVTMEELKNGYLRQKDYTQKTQEVATQRKQSQEAIEFYESIKQNPQLAQQIKQVAVVPPSIDPATARVAELENKLYDMALEREIEGLQNKYPDFEVREVLQMAEQKKITNLEDAYHLVKSTKPTQSTDTEALKQTLRQQILDELKQEGINTQTLISSNDGTTVVPDNKPTITSAEQKVARNMRLSDEEYVKWRDAPNIKKK